MPIVITELHIACPWGGTLAGVLLRNDDVTSNESFQTTTKMIAIHGWLDNLNSMLPLARRLVDHHPSETSIGIE